jgi:(1->4)-alpha-D-glucan 1-alpha-D-glucosylmutase
MDAWISTYRLQLHSGFTLKDACRVLPYLRKLGVSHVYLSPCLQAAPGSTHGYDLADPTRINEEIGGEEGWAEFQKAVRENDLGVLLDIVPNHMTTHAANVWWNDILMHGPFSQYAGFFDVFPREATSRWRIRLSVLGEPYPDAIASENLFIDLSGETPRIRYYENYFPLAPCSWNLIMCNLDDEEAEVMKKLELYGNGIEKIRKDDYGALVRRGLNVIADVRQDSDRMQSWQNRCSLLMNDPERFHALLERQFYQLCWWRLEGEVVNYRRFFNIGSLIGLRVDKEEVFRASHQRIAAMIEKEEVDGLRIDHPDGLRDPANYFKRLRRLLPHGRIYVEKILDTSEVLPPSWPVDGTVGYEFLSIVNRLWMDEHKADAFNAIYADFTGHPTNFPVLLREKKFEVIDGHFTSDLERLASIAHKIAEDRWQTRDLSREQLVQFIRAATVSLSVYRTYRSPRSPGTTDTDARLISEACAAARTLCPEVDVRVAAFVEELLAGDLNDPARADFVLRWQQLTPPVMAKGAEDTTFYCYDRLVSANEVGSQPSLLGVSAEQFHQFCSFFASNWPGNLLASSTHDTKRSEDVRARICVLSEIPERWTAMLYEWAQMNEAAWRGRWKDRHSEYLLYQTLIGAWPISAERAKEYMIKAVREAKIHTNWHEPNANYELAITEFIDEILASGAFVKSLEDFLDTLTYYGRINSLSQTLIKLTAPGTPDFYQGTELWDLSLVDPDNRRPVDFQHREKLLAQCEKMSAADVVQEWDSGIPKLWMIHRVLRERRKCLECFLPGASYRPVSAQGTRLGHLLTYLRADRVAVIVPRFLMSMREGWEDTSLLLPEGKWRNVFTEATFEGEVRPGDVFGAFPVAMLALE